MQAECQVAEEALQVKLQFEHAILQNTDAIPDVEILDNGVLLVEYAGNTVYQETLCADIIPGRAKVKWSRKRGTLTFTAPRTEITGKPTIGTITQGVIAPSSISSVAGSATAGPRAKSLPEGNLNSATSCLPETASTTTGNECLDTGLQEMYGAEIFAPLQHQQQGLPSGQPDQPSYSNGHQRQGFEQVSTYQQRQPSCSQYSQKTFPQAQKQAETQGSSASGIYSQQSTIADCLQHPTNSAPPLPSSSNLDPLAPSRLHPSKNTELPFQLHPWHHHTTDLPSLCTPTDHHYFSSAATSSSSSCNHNAPSVAIPKSSTAQHPTPYVSNSKSNLCNGEAKVPEAQGVDCLTLASALHAVAGPSKSSKPSKKAAKDEKRRVAPMLDAIAESLATNHWAVCDNYVPMDQVIEVRKEMKRLEEHYVEGEIWVGKEADAGATIACKDVRGDVVLWLDKAALEATAYVKDGEKHSCSFRALKRVMESIDSLVKEQLASISQTCANIRERSDAMMAIYPGRGSRFAKHIDNTANDGRRLTLLCYLNPNWKEANGGALRLTPPNGKVVDVFPQAGRLAMFLSKTVAHEVLPTQVPRHSFTLWYYDALERAEAIASAQVHGRGKASEAEQQEARGLIRDMLSRGGGIQATYEGVAALQQRVKGSSLACMDIVASIVGAPLTQVFLDAIEHMVPSELENLNSQLAHMGQGANRAHAPSF